ncbi:MAG: exosortase A [Pseudomonadota bacterium]|nr:exosortase A [Pseudomonadota bacterium]
MTAVLPIEQSEPLGRRAIGTWRPHLVALAAVGAVILLLFHEDVADLAGIWAESATFNHCVLILPIIGWLVWQRLPELQQIVPSAWASGLGIVAVGALAWLLGFAGGVALARHAGVVLMLQGAVIACLGRDLARALAFPIFYALFLIPAGDQLVPPLQTLTAQMSMVLLGLVGVPAHIEGIFITTPTGYFEVAEACSGVQFLIAMIAYGALVANVCFRSWRRRILFLLAAATIPILANGVRAWATIYIAHLTSNDFAAGFDHIVFGWIFFGLVMAFLMAAGWPFFDRGPGDPWSFPAKVQRTRHPSSPLAAVTAAVLALAALPLAWLTVAASSSEESAAAFALPVVEGWERVQPSARHPWRPHFAGADLMLMGRYRSKAGEEVDLAISVYRRQDEGRELVGYGQGAVGPNSRWAWTGSGAPPPGGRLDRIASHRTVREVASFYRVGRVLTGSDYAVKLETMKTRLFGGPQRAVAILVSAEAPAESVDPRPAIDAFLSALGPIEALADRAAGLPQQ